MQDTSEAPPASTLATRDHAQATGEGPSNGGVDLAPSVIVGSCIVVLYFTWRFLEYHLTWFRPFLRDFAGWLVHPTIAGGLHATRPLLAAFVFALAGAVGWVAAGMLLSGTRYSEDWAVRAGLTIALAVATLGYAGMLGLVFGMLEPFALFAFVGSLGAGLVYVHHRVGRSSDAKDAEEEPDEPVAVRSASRLRSRPLTVVTAAVVAVMLGWMLVHASLAPVTEWDAIVYHAASAKLWFEQRPDPPLVYGPSVGIELSGNYPPLFPAAGAAVYTMVGRFDDLYLRLLPPLLFLSIVLMTFGFARRRFDENSACCSALLLCGTPLLVMYGVWQTSYILTTALVLATLVISDAATQSGRLGLWGVAGAFAGLSILSNVYGLVALPVGAATLLMARKRTRVSSLVVFAGVALAVASPWLLRNLVLLHDPFWPFASPPFHGKGLIEPFWRATQDEIRSSALFGLGVSQGEPARLAGLKKALFDPVLLPVGLYVGLAFAFVRARAERMVGVIGLGLALVLLVLLAPGWYWLRGILPALPLAAILTGRATWWLLQVARNAAKRTRRLAGALALVLASTTASVAIGAGAAVGLALAIAGPNQDTWTTNMSSENDLMRGVKELGSTPSTLWNTYSGDALLFRYMNSVVRPDARVATLENWIYYLNRATTIFYLDGREAAPLVHIRDPQDVETFFRERDVRYVVAPSWTVIGRARFPILDQLPLFRMLGTEQFPAVAAFPVRGYEVPSLVYSVGSSSVSPTIGVYPGYGQPEPSLSGGQVTIQPGATDPRISVPLVPDKRVALRFQYALSGTGRFSINLYDLRLGRWDYDLLDRDRPDRSGWGAALLPLPRRGAYAQLGLYVQGDPLTIRNLAVVPVPIAGGSRK